VKCFVEGSAIGWANFLYGDNAAAVAAIQAANPEMSGEQLAHSIAAMKDHGIVDSGDAETLGIGAMTDARIRDFYDKMVDCRRDRAGARHRQGLHAGLRQFRGLAAE
jgi:NitT/TauT family transport system substrate-binding protein